MGWELEEKRVGLLIQSRMGRKREQGRDEQRREGTRREEGVDKE